MWKVSRSLVAALGVSLALTVGQPGAGLAEPGPGERLIGPTRVTVDLLPPPAELGRTAARLGAPGQPSATDHASRPWMRPGARDDATAEPAEANSLDSSVSPRGDLQPLAPPSLSPVAFEGLDDDDNIALLGLTTTPPDPQIAVGPNHVFEMVNIIGRIYDKDGGTVQTFSLEDFFDVPPGWFDFDPKVIYDVLSGRWFAAYASLLDNPSGTDFGRLHLAISRNSNPTSGWSVYYVEYTNIFPDYPAIGVSSDKFTISSNLFDIDGVPPVCGFCGDVETIVVNKADMMAGASSPAAFFFAPDAGRFTVRPAHSLSPGNDQYLATYDLFSLNQLTLLRITGTPPGAVTEATPVNLVVANQLSPPDSLTAGPGSIDSGDFRLLDATWRSGRLWVSASAACTPSGDGTTRSCAHVTEVNTGTLSVAQDIMFGASGQYYSWPALRTDSQSNLYVSLTHTNPSIFAEARMTGRAAGEPANTMSGSTLLQAGEVVHTSGRWGDYLGVALDPSATGCVWLVGEYAEDTAVRNWGTYIATASYSGACTADTDGDTVPDIDDADDDADLVADEAESLCGGDPLNAARRPELVDPAGSDEDGDTLVDEALPASGGLFDCDGDGFIGDLETFVGTGAQARCADTWYPPIANINDESDDEWPLDINDDGRANLTDINLFFFPVRRFLVPANYDARWDLDANGVINIIDFNLISTTRPAMLNFERAWTKQCVP